MTWWMMLAALFIFVVVHGYLVRWIAGALAGDDKKNVAAFSFVLGMAYIASGPINNLDGALKLGASLGYIGGVSAVWFLFFKRVKADG
ncbi:MAG: hypothetical protein DI591_06960 [Citromicrobium sp.]|nr:MAG: hypothetical protein DI591_06960 [Citromicrobium sp.]